MTDDVAHVMLEHLKAIRSGQTAMQFDLVDIKGRLSSLGVHFGGMQTQYAVESVRLDRFNERLGRIERRLELVDA